MGSCELNGPPNRSLRAENRPDHFSRARGRSDASPKTIPDSGFPARADSADETYVSVALLPANPRHVRMNPFILCPGGPNGSSDAQIELGRAKNCGACESAPCALCRASSCRMPADGAGSKVHLRCPFQGARRALADALGRKSSWRPAGNCWIPLSLLPPPAAAPKRTKISAMVQVCAAGIAAQSTLPGALQHAEEWRVGGCGRAQGQGLGRRHAGSPAALPTWPPMVAKCSVMIGGH